MLLSGRKLAKYSKKILGKNIREKLLDNPYQTFNHQYKCIYIHIPKCAGISIGKALFNQMIGHSKNWYYQFHDPVLFEKYYKFTFVRNPWDRLVSAYHFLKNGGRNKKDLQWALKNLKPVTSFDQFVQKLDKDLVFRYKILNHQHFRPQNEFLMDLDGVLNLNFIGRFEKMEEHFDQICGHLHINAELPLINKGKHQTYTNYFKPETIDIVKKIFKEDIELLDYSFY